MVVFDRACGLARPHLLCDQIAARLVYLPVCSLTGGHAASLSAARPTPALVICVVSEHAVGHSWFA